VRAVLNNHVATSKNRYGDINENSPYYSVELISSSKKERSAINEDNKVDSTKRSILKFVNDSNRDNGYCTYSELTKAKVGGDKTKLPSIFADMVANNMLSTSKPTAEEVAKYAVHPASRLIQAIGNWAYNV
jgi:hypothetical protein